MTLNNGGENVPLVPTLFIVPLGLYLITFIIAFDHQRWYYRPVFCVLLLLAIMGAVVVERRGQYPVVTRSGLFEPDSTLRPASD